MTISNFFKECHKREVFKLLSIYIVSSWIVLQVLSVVWQPLGLPEKSVTFLIIALLAGFPIYIYILWKIRFRYAKSKKKEKDIEVNIKNEVSFKRMYFTGLSLIGLFATVSVIFIFNTNFGKNIKLAVFDTSNKIAVLKFTNNTGDNQLDIIEQMALSWIEHGITESKVGQVINQENVNEYSNVIKAQSIKISDQDILNRYLKPSKMVTGSFFLDDGKLIFRCSIKDGSNNETLISFKQVECDSSSPLECIEELQQNILGYLAIDGSIDKGLDQIPPKFEAYKYFMEAKSNFKNKPLYLDLLNKSVEADSSYFEALAHKVLYYYNAGDFATFDSLRQKILPRSGISERQRNLMDHYDAMVKGDNSRIYTTSINEYQYNTFNLRTNQSMMVFALQYVNKPEEVDFYYNEIKMDEFDLGSCLVCVFRYYTKAVADIELKKYSDAIDLLENVIKSSDHLLLKKALITAYVRTNNIESLNALLDKIKLTHNSRDWEESNIFAGKELLLTNDRPDLPNNYFNNVINESGEKNGRNYANAHYYKGDYEKSEQLLRKLHEESPENVNHLSKLAISLFKMGNNAEAENLTFKLNGQRTSFQFGLIDYALAQIYASQGKNDIAMSRLLASVAAGNRYRHESYQNDFHFKAIINTPEFDKVMNFWAN
jgi:tetratricopeptide (TPR) repeat protein